MNINNVVLVRVMTHLPLNGELIPSCEGQRLINEEKNDFYFFIKGYVKKELEKQLGRILDEYNSSDEKMLKDMLKKYLVLTGDYYTTTLSFSLNGMVPDDRHNKFSSMKIAVIDPIKNHIHDDFVTVETIDTTIKGRIKVSNEAILLIEKDIFVFLSDEIKNNLKSNYNVKLFEGNLKDAINDTLEEHNYPALPLVQSRENSNIDDCPLKQSMLEFEDNFANMVNASRARLQDLTYMYSSSSVEVDRIAHDKLEEEHPNSLKVDEYYRNQLYSFLLAKAEEMEIKITDGDKHDLFIDEKYSKEPMERITSCLIELYGGIENFQKFIQEYNQYVVNNYLTNKQIINSAKNIKK